MNVVPIDQMDSLAVVNSLSGGNFSASTYGTASMARKWVNQPDQENMNPSSLVTTKQFPGEPGELQNATTQGDTQVKSAQSLAASIRRDSELLARLDKREFLAVASDIRRKSRQIEASLDGHPHAHMREHYRDDPWIADILAAELSENVSD